MIRATATFRPRGDLGRYVETHIGPATRAAVSESCQLLESRMKELCPVDTGRLQSSITTEIQELPRTIRGEVGPHTDYAAYVEFGTGIAGAGSPGAGKGPYSSSWPGMPAQPYVRPALDESRKAVLDIFAHDIALAVRS